MNFFNESFTCLIAVKRITRTNGIMLTKGDLGGLGVKNFSNTNHQEMVEKIQNYDLYKYQYYYNA